VEPALWDSLQTAMSFSPTTVLSPWGRGWIAQRLAPCTLPYRSVTEKSTLLVLSSLASSARQTGHGRGNFLVGISKTLLRESGFTPDIVGRLTCNTEEGTESDDGVYLGDGLPPRSGSLSFVKRRAPLALSLSVGYQDFGKQGNTTPGNTFNRSRRLSAQHRGYGYALRSSRADTTG
jgi:hypothetical protein